MSIPRILVVDDEEEILEVISLFLKRENFDVICLKCGSKVIETVQEKNPDLLLLDTLLPDIDGLELCRELRAFTNVPIILISYKNEEMDKVIGLSIGGDDYITKPFGPMELVARIKSHLRRNRFLQPKHKLPSKIMKFDELEVDFLMQKVSLKGSNVPLTAREFKLLSQLVQHPGRIYKMEELYELVWGFDSISDTRTIMVHISNLRRKLEEDPGNPYYIQTVRGAGYRFNEKYINGCDLPKEIFR